METNIVCHFLLILAVACMVVAAAIQYHVYRNDFPSTVNTGNIKHYYQYDTTAFIFAAVAAIIAHVLTVTDREIQCRAMWRYLYYGIVFFIAVLSVNNIAFLNQARQQHNISGAPNYWKKTLAALIIGYFGLWIGLWVVHGNFKIRSWLAVIFYICSVCLAIVGFVILWTLTSSTVSAFVLTDISIPLILILLFLSGPVFHEHLDGGFAAVLLIGLYGLWFLANTFQLQEMTEDANENQNAQRKAWAGGLFCWFSALAALFTARFALDVPIVNA